MLLRQSLKIAKLCTFNSEEIMLSSGHIYSITLICNDENNRRLRRGGECDDIKPSFTGVEVSDVAVTDNKDGSYAITFCPRHGGMLKFDASINGVPSPNCTLNKQVMKPDEFWLYEYSKFE